MENFFTPTEMKDGLTSPGRVEELVNLMQKEKDQAVKNVGKAIRQWCTVASTIAITANRQCLDRFLDLNGLLLLKTWLVDAEKFCNGTNDSVAEESIIALLRAIERLHAPNKRVWFSGTMTMVKNLFEHKSSSVQHSAKALFYSWVDVVSTIEEDSRFNEAQFTSDIDRKSGLLGSTAKDTNGALSEGKERENNRTGNELTRSSDDLQMEDVAGEQRKSSIVQANGVSSSDNECTENETSVPSTGLRTPPKENVPIKEGTIIVPSESITSIENFSSPNSIRGINEIMLNVDVTDDDGKATSKSNNSLEDSPAIELLSSFPMQTGLGIVMTDASKAVVTMKETDTNIGVKDVNLVPKNVSNGDVDVSTSDVESGLVLRRTKGDVDPDITISKKDINLVEEGHAIEDDMNPAQEGEEPGSDEDEDMPDLSETLNPKMDSLDSDVISKRSDIDIDPEYGYVDALKVARQVAKAVKKEVGEYGEPCSSYSEKMSDRSMELPSSSESINRQENKSPESQKEETSARLNTCVQASPIIDANIISSDYTGNNKQDKNTHDNETFQVTEAAAQEPQINAEKGSWDFDLNEACFEDAEQPSNPLSPTSTAAVSVVSASRAAAVDGLPASPLQFEGTLGWKGSATNSAFRAASPRRSAETDKLYNGSASGSLKRTNYALEIDLNMSEGVDDDTADPILGRQLPVSSGFRSGSSGFRSVSPKRPRILMLDLNQTDDDGYVPVSEVRTDRRLVNSRHNGLINPSPASSSSSVPAFLKNIESNNRPTPTINYDLSDQQHHFRKLASQYGSPCGGQRTAVHPVISIMGTKVEVDRRDHIPQLMPLTSGKSPDTTGMDIFTRTGNFHAAGPPIISYENSSPYGYSGLTQGPAMSFYSPGTPIPYMVDSRGTPIVPQIMGYAPAPAAFPPPYSHQQFNPTTAGAPQQPLNGAGPSHSSFNLNLGLMSDGMNNTTRGSRPFFLPSDGRTTTVDYLRPDLQPSSSGIGGKRKEPDGGWEHYPFNTKHRQPPPWK